MGGLFSNPTTLNHRGKIMRINKLAAAAVAVLALSAQSVWAQSEGLGIGGLSTGATLGVGAAVAATTLTVVKNNTTTGTK
jgi:hypothetical protein